VQALDVLDELAIDQDTRCCLCAPDPGNNEVNDRLPTLEIGPKRASVEEVASHSVMGGVGGLS
jgi:hypothetical protein